MKYLISLPPEKAEEGTWAPAGEPVVPWYLQGDAFVAVPSFMLSKYAEVKDDPAFDPDQLVKALKKQFPGIPDTMHENYVMAVAMAAHNFPVGTKLQIFFNGNAANLKVLSKEEFYSLWKEQPK